ncbi:MAG: glycosyltransferase family 2 protein [Oscillatoria sp. PMC 1051.18]|uniref:glycosyltransferase family 2 protein n=1 Tax=Oscillatoria salina TaxID=331517 RepID=UPI0013B7FF11|nr:glycosyltransferase family 2 protein [Oscillatoria salina]MBZ8180603.1 glycosyltransferase family 2 protein [Oscillatoria salina IIICB1]MEC4894181.1 glycosyltransferase family 2 protein [Oscillatoria sp. PMC 1050.18]MEC5030933.1 glycosyltransferase family 2 protein [Oscillatoria sp. PMC 1051.18]NET88454.1 glycosyltransferase family 2 protein [Kamptonema sp. SIO1D9]
MNKPVLSIIIPTYNRPHLLPIAVNSALAQTRADFEVIVVDDASPQPVNLPEHPKLKIIRLPENKGGSAARNVGAKAANGHWITYLDDDDILLPHMAEVSLEALANTTLPKPVAALSGVEVVSEDGWVKKTRIPPTLPKGSHFCLEEIEPEKSFFCKQTMVVEKEVLLSIGGFDESFSSRVHTELFLRLNQVCSLQGIPTVTYQLLSHQSFRVSSDPSRRQVNFHRLISKHRALFEAHPKMFANFIYDHAMKSYDSGQKLEAVKSFSQAMGVHPIHTLGRMVSPFKKALLSRMPKFQQKLLKQN